MIEIHQFLRHQKLVPRPTFGISVIFLLWCFQQCSRDHQCQKCQFNPESITGVITIQREIIVVIEIEIKTEIEVRVEVEAEAEAEAGIEVEVGMITEAEIEATIDTTEIMAVTTEDNNQSS